ncbi:hypothetical protein F4779DRAFT_263321 [Xylariaceae sp. FL0662B]|nr:hypothetical protein F4779DRAFT_263321 [Xylariaceae sp. FL0662B]
MSHPSWSSQSITNILKMQVAHIILFFFWVTTVSSGTPCHYVANATDIPRNSTKSVGCRLLMMYPMKSFNETYKLSNACGKSSMGKYPVASATGPIKWLPSCDLMTGQNNGLGDLVVDTFTEPEWNSFSYNKTPASRSVGCDFAFQLSNLSTSTLAYIGGQDLIDISSDALS